jgi:ABC-type phosphate transport system substrate-binding protein
VAWALSSATLLGALMVLAAAPVSAPASAAVIAAADPGSVTVPAPGAGPGASVTVSKVSGLVNQAVAVSWDGFRPSSDTRLANAGDSLDINTERPVRVYQCRGSDPASSSDCYGSPGFRGIEATADAPALPPVPPFTYPGQQNAFDATPDGPANWQDNVTRADGTGEVSVQVFTKRESAALGCDADAPCSLVVVPNYGRPNGATEDQMDAPWAWSRRTVVPLTFLPVKDACPLTGDALRVEGSPMVGSTIASWRARTCTLAADPVTLDYTAIGEPQTRGDVASSTTNVGLVIDPLDKADAKLAGVVYAPVSVTGLVVAFQIDDADGKPVTDLNLNARLVAKMVTASYRSGGNQAVINNPVNIFRDPELKALNPNVTFPGGAPGNHVLILGDTSDTTRALTRWLASDPDAAAFINGTPDPWGMTVNTNYAALALPFDNFPLLDQLMSDTFAPIQELDSLSRQLSIAQFPGATTVVEDGVNVTLKPPRQNPGRREVIGIIDAASAARFRLSTAALQNAAGVFVKPTTDSMLDAIAHAKVNKDGVTRSVDLTAKNPGSYPLTLQVSAALSTKAPETERAEMARFLSYVADAGQVSGDDVGQLPAGHAPLDATLRGQVLAARKAVLKGFVEPTATPTESASPTADPTDPSDAPSDGGGGAPPDVVGPAPVAAGPSADPLLHDPQPSNPAPSMVTVAAQLAGHKLVILPLLAILAVVSLAGGPVLMWLSQTGRGPQWLRR